MNLPGRDAGHTAGGTPSPVSAAYGSDSATGALLTVDYEDPDTADITHTYDRLGRRATVTDATGTLSFDDAATLQLEKRTSTPPSTTA